jgi:hypothetical protein
MFRTSVFLLATLAYFDTSWTSKDVCHDGVVNQGLCQKFCHNSSCECSMSSQSQVTSCTQTCHWLHSQSCPRMSCDGHNSCNQHCYRGECNMDCFSTSMCSQLCSWEARCKHLKCSAKVCHQICSDCSMECSSDADRCEQMCESGVCDMTCHAKKCRRMCNGKCNVVGTSSQGAPSQRALVYEPIVMVLFPLILVM